MADQFQREQEIIALRQHIEQTFSNNPSVLSALRDNADALDFELRQLPSGTSPGVAIDYLSTQQWFREAIQGDIYGTSGEQVDESSEQTWQSDYDIAYQECQEAAINAGALKPQGWKERMAAGITEGNGGRWADTPVARARLEAWTQEYMRRRGFST
jgi:hypothetical protein